MTLDKNFTPKKTLAQNFLINESIIEKIINFCDLKSNDTVLEIGPGKGALTYKIAKQVKEVIAVEKDEHLAQHLQKEFENTNVRVICADILNYPLNELPPNTKVIGNLPYNAATPIITKILEHKNLFREMYITVQLEYGGRLAAKPHTKSYGAFSCFVQYHTNPKILMKIRNSAFQPIPKVQSCFLHLEIPKKPKYTVKNKAFLFKIIQTCFKQRRKKINNSLAGILNKKEIPQLLDNLNIDQKLRAENIGLEQYVQIANAVS